MKNLVALKKVLLVILACLTSYELTLAQRGTNQEIEQAIKDDCYNFHHKINNFYISDYLNMEIAGEYALKGGGSFDDISFFNDVDNYTLKSNSTSPMSIWMTYYGGIEKCNQVLYHLSDTPENIRYRAEAKFVRAYNYFHLVTLFGDLPLLLTTHEKISQSLVRVPEVQIYAQIEQDLTDAIPSLPNRSELSTDEKYRVTKGAALTLLGKVCLYQQKWNEAKNYLQTVVNSGQYALLSDYNNLWLMENEHNIESIFEYEYFSDINNSWGNVSSKNISGNINAQMIGPRISEIGTSGLLHGWSFMPIKKELADLFDQNNDVVRKNATLITPGFFTTYNATYDPGFQNTDYFCKKYTTYSNYTNSYDRELNYGQNIIKMRYADVLLMLAEAETRVGNSMQAIQYINMVRQRAGLAQLSPSLNGPQLLEAIFNERTLEFALEGDRYRELIRWGKAETILTPLGYSNTSNGKWPIPQNLINENELLTQNSGYTDNEVTENKNFTLISNAYHPNAELPWIKKSGSTIKPTEGNVYQYNYALDDSILQYHLIYSYNANMLMTEYVQNWYNKTTKQWQEVYKEEYKYNTNNQLIFSGTFKKSNQEWDSIDAHHYQYPSSNVTIDSLTQSYNNSTKAFNNIDINTFEWDNTSKSYIINNNRYWYNSTDKIYDLAFSTQPIKHILEYDIQDNIVKDSKFSFNTDWNLESVINYIYINNLLKEESDGTYKTIYSYSDNNNNKTVANYPDALITSPQTGELILTENTQEIRSSLKYQPLIGALRSNLTRSFYNFSPATSIEATNSRSDNTLIISPNPSKGEFTISGLKSFPATIEILNLSGVMVAKEIITFNTQKINVSFLNNGIYILKSNNNQLQSTIVIKK